MIAPAGPLLQRLRGSGGGQSCTEARPAMVEIQELVKLMLISLLLSSGVNIVDGEQEDEFSVPYRLKIGELPIPAEDSIICSKSSENATSICDPDGLLSRFAQKIPVLSLYCIILFDGCFTAPALSEHKKSSRTSHRTSSCAVRTPVSYLPIQNRFISASQAS